MAVSGFVAADELVDLGDSRTRMTDRMTNAYGT